MQINEVKLGDIKRLYPRREKNSFKGMNGKVLVVGGSIDFLGAPVLCALGALNSGADLVYLMVPEANFDVVRGMYPDFIVRKFPGEYLDLRGVSPILSLAKKCDSIVLGPGLSEREDTKEALLNIVTSLEIPTVLDADAIFTLQNIKEFPLKQPILITPHHHEFEMLTEKSIKITSDPTNKVNLLRTLATDLKINILLKGPEDLIATEQGEISNNITGDAGMTVGGSGDVLSGFACSLIAQGLTPFDAAKMAAFVFGKAGENLFKQKAYCYSALDLAMELPYVMKSFQP